MAERQPQRGTYHKLLIRLTPELFEAVKAAAHAEDLSVSGKIVRLIRHGISEHEHEHEMVRTSQSDAAPVTPPPRHGLQPTQPLNGGYGRY